MSHACNAASRFHLGSTNRDHDTLPHGPRRRCRGIQKYKRYHNGCYSSSSSSCRILSQDSPIDHKRISFYLPDPLLKCTYLLSKNYVNSITVGNYPNLSPEPLITLNKGIYLGLMLTIDEWELFLTLKPIIENHFEKNTKANEQKKFEIGPYSVVKLIKSHSGEPLITIGPGNVTPPQERGGYTVVCFNIYAWYTLMDLLLSINYAINVRKTWSPYVQELYEIILESFHEKYTNTDVCGLDSMRTETLELVLNNVLSEKINSYEHLFDVTQFVLEFKKYYSDVIFNESLLKRKE